MLNAVIIISVTLFGVSAGAVLGTRSRVGRRFPATPGLTDIVLLVALFAGAWVEGLRVWGHWLHFIGWLAACVASGAVAQWLKPAPRATHGLTQ